MSRRCLRALVSTVESDSGGLMPSAMLLGDRRVRAEDAPLWGEAGVRFHREGGGRVVARGFRGSEDVRKFRRLLGKDVELCAWCGCCGACALPFCMRCGHLGGSACASCEERWVQVLEAFFWS